MPGQIGLQDVRAICRIHHLEFLQLDVGHFGGVPQHGNPADLQRQRGVVWHFLLRVVVLIGRVVDVTGGDERVGGVYRRHIGSAEANDRGRKAGVVAGRKRVAPQNVERLGVRPIVLQDRGVRAERGRKIAADETGAGHATGGVHVRRIERDDLLRGRDGIGVFPFGVEEAKGHELGRQKVLVGFDRISQRRFGFHIVLGRIGNDRVGERVVRIGAGGSARLNLQVVRDP